MAPPLLGVFLCTLLMDLRREFEKACNENDIDALEKTELPDCILPCVIRAAANDQTAVLLHLLSRRQTENGITLLEEARKMSEHCLQYPHAGQECKKLVDVASNVLFLDNQAVLFRLISSMMARRPQAGEYDARASDWQSFWMMTIHDIIKKWPASSTNDIFVVSNISLCGEFSSEFAMDDVLSSGTIVECVHDFGEKIVEEEDTDFDLNLLQADVTRYSLFCLNGRAILNSRRGVKDKPPFVDALRLIYPFEDHYYEACVLRKDFHDFLRDVAFTKIVFTMSDEDTDSCENRPHDKKEDLTWSFQFKRRRAGYFGP